MSKSVSQKRKKRKLNRINKMELPPGSLLYFGEKEKAIDIDVISYKDSFFYSGKVNSVTEALSFVSAQNCTWININGLNNIDEIKRVGEFTNLHSLLLEDILDTEHRPKSEILDNNLLIIIKMIYFGKDKQIISEHLALILGERYIISFQEVEGQDVFGSLRKRLITNVNNIREKDIDYLLFGLLDAVIDNYFLVLDKIGSKIEDIEDEIINNPDEKIILEIQSLKKNAIFLQKSIVPVREITSKLEKINHHLITADTKHYFRDLHDHTIQIVETLGTYRDILWGLTDTYMGAMSNKMNNIMRLLTLISTIFIPLTFIVGVYGMNFDFMPELRYKWSYFIVWGIMILLSFLMILYFKSKKWL
ncbi:magnesium transport protein CorA [Capnocytophaga cynodegmi]|uniref:magnesium/cobalt transporter CorA n=1 Tax=Capnocytophaga cynodegmi TaxID=28189 RepID=UPI001AC84156|nr:magnesium/cobalt transporter CorA [Capnocytophaga cynodegmi]GIM51942.1 magnesium transport protein CorA [Capnocytophaga cynodegmi]